MRVLHYGNRRGEDYYWDASTGEKEKAALRQLFKILRDWGVYSDLESKGVRDMEVEIANQKKVIAKLSDPDVQNLVADDISGRTSQLEHLEHRLGELRHQSDLYLRAKKGDDKRLKALLEMRNGSEYEELEWIDVKDPLARSKRA